jgi:hypothetical protein
MRVSLPVCAALALAQAGAAHQANQQINGQIVVTAVQKITTISGNLNDRITPINSPATLIGVRITSRSILFLQGVDPPPGDCQWFEGHCSGGDEGHRDLRLLQRQDDPEA